ncbi:PrpR N-terminal domain-containing protein [Planococcus maritimus]|uniref:PrpR N-terminal domain-containing protein n=1 Tax=Planococcus maritimus TaxID=192421 RepID=UPI003138D28B
MRKVKVGFISPYEAMLPLIDELAVEQNDIEITRAVGNLEAGVALALEMERNGADVLISRGGTAKMIREAVSLPVVEIHISGYDLLRSIMLAEGHSNELKALIGFPNITMGAASIVSLLELKLEVVALSSATEVDNVLKGLKSRGVKQVLGDVVTIDAAAKMGLSGLLIQSGRETLLEAFEEARRLFWYAEKNQQQLRSLEMLVDRWRKDVVILAEDGEVLFERFPSFQEMPISHTELMELRTQVLASRTALVKLHGDVQPPFFVTGELLEDRSGLLTAWTFESLSLEDNHAAFSVAQPARLPFIVSESAGMKQVRQLIESHRDAEQSLVLVGENSTGKQTLAEYAHVFHDRKGLVLTVEMAKLKHPLPVFQLPEQSTLVLAADGLMEPSNIRLAEELIQSFQSADLQIIATVPVAHERIVDVLGSPLVVQVPPIRERAADIPYLVNQLLTEYHQDLGTQPVRLREEAMALLTDHNWPGNLTEMKSYVRQLALAEKSYVIEPQAVKALPFEKKDGATPRLPLNPTDSLKEIERQIIEQVLKEENDNQTQAAKRLGINRATLWRKLKD